MSRPSLCLTMIVRDEAAVIERSLAQLKPLVDRWCIVDTGSVDDTCARVEAAMAALPGELHRRPWVNFGHNRSEAFRLARGQADYLFFFDADDLLLTAPGWSFPELSHDAYFGTFVEDDLEYRRLTVLSTRLPWRCEGVIHPYFTPDRSFTKATVPGLRIESRRDGARSAIDSRVKYSRNAEILKKQLRKHPRDPRALFYYAMSLRDAERFVEALAAFQRRAALGGVDEEGWFALLQVAALQQRLEHPPAVVEASYRAAHEARPSRAEALGMLARYLRLSGPDWPRARDCAAQALRIPLPEDDILFIDRSWYAWRCLDEYAVASYWCGDVRAAREANEALLANPALPDRHRARIQDNLRLCRSPWERRLEGWWEKLRGGGRSA